MSGQSAGSAQTSSWVGFPMVWRRSNVVHGKLWFRASGHVGFDAALLSRGSGKVTGLRRQSKPRRPKARQSASMGGRSSRHAGHRLAAAIRAPRSRSQAAAVVRP
ncbi:unnamed protein product, partial [Ixodes pacificus]